MIFAKSSRNLGSVATSSTHDLRKVIPKSWVSCNFLPRATINNHFASSAGFEEFPGVKVDDDISAAVELTVPLTFSAWYRSPLGNLPLTLHCELSLFAHLDTWCCTFQLFGDCSVAHPCSSSCLALCQ